MTPTKRDVKNWLKAIGKDCDWLARKCGTRKERSTQLAFPPAPSSNAILKIHS